MKIEKLSENQIRCTLNKSDLASRHLKISELAYGSEKAKELFRDMMKQASYELGFEADDIPLMIEAIPVSSECIVLIVTKVDDPEELDTRFSKFSPFGDEYDDDEIPFDDYDSLETIDSYGYDDMNIPSADDELDYSDDAVDNDIFNLFNKVNKYLNESDNSSDTIINPVSESNTDSDNLYNRDNNTPDNNERIVRIFSFRDFDTFTEVAKVIQPVFTGRSSIYKSPKDMRYYLTLEKGRCSSINFNKTCNMLSEYGTKENMNSASVDFFEEHWECLIKGHAIQAGARL